MAPVSARDVHARGMARQARRRRRRAGFCLPPRASALPTFPGGGGALGGDYDASSTLAVPEQYSPVVNAAMDEGSPPSPAGEASQALAWMETDTLALLGALQPRLAVGEEGLVEVGVTLTSDEGIAALNAEWRGKQGPTDVLSFPCAPMAFLAGTGEPQPVGDLVVSLDAARRQAAERGHGLRDELRVLLLHGALHLEGRDHELGEAEEAQMAEEEEAYMVQLGWVGKGLIEAVTGMVPAQAEVDAEIAAAPRPLRAPSLVAIDMDGTLLDGASQVRPAVASALRAASERGVTVAIATGKARPAVERALAAAGLDGAGGVFNDQSPGIFLQGQVLHGPGGAVLAEQELDAAIARAVLRLAEEDGLAAVAFVDRTRCAAIRPHPRITELHEKYWEPQAELHASVDALVAAYDRVNKLILMAEPEDITGVVKPRVQALLAELGGGAQTVQAVPDMLEVCPQGANKAPALARLAEAMGLDLELDVVAIGDGDNDLEMVRAAGFGVAMGNARPAVLGAAQAVVASNDEEGVAEALEKFVLSMHP